MPNEGKSLFPFHYGNEAESYTFYRVPKILFTEKVFDQLSTDAKLLYGLLLDRMQLSLKSGCPRLFVRVQAEPLGTAGCGQDSGGNQGGEAAGL